MALQWIYILTLLLLDHKCTDAAVHTLKEGQAFPIECVPSETGSMVVWFRVLDGSGVDFIASFSNQGMIKSEGASYSGTFAGKSMANNVMTVASFSRDRDSGLYSCASLKNNQLLFGAVTRLQGEKTEAALKETPAPAVKATAASPCVCHTTPKEDDLLCSPTVLIPLAGSCVLLVLIILILIVYCNQVRTRRCPHHYKRRPQKMAAVKKQPAQHT
ncbi:T-cell surface glycoprotein CD8 alpha chain [Entelurus aequoreus]|uniref:T-cell surface glycoprotein CD8 alpha chain n=1 Tax=Entelurus aequoreus TaxID=161455 RepID=UPI002B1D72C7|nr:T-cell surface glycoprotein CD8 alpha chain [Entelurus aequoreus]